MSKIYWNNLDPEVIAKINSNNEGAAPLEHTHKITDVTDLQTTLDTKVSQAELSDAIVNVSDNIMGLFTILDEHSKALIVSETGLHGIRVWNGKFEQYDSLNNTWVKIIEDIDTSNLRISANQIDETSDKVLITASERATIQSATADISSMGQKIVDLENLTNSIQGATDELVKLDENDVAGYLGTKFDDSTIQISNNKLVAKNIEGLTSTITELNLLQGATSNIQAQIDSLNSVGNFTTSVDTKLELDSLTDATPNDMAIVISDESLQESPTSIYIYNGNTWMFAGFFKSGELRDFILNPLNLSTETTGVLPKSKYELQNASDTSFNDSNGFIKSTNTQDAIKELFTYSNEGKKRVATSLGKPLLTSDTYEQMSTKIIQLKTLLADVITSKGVPSYNYNTLEEFANKISIIPNVTVSGTVKKSPKYTIVAPSEIQVVLDEALNLTDITTTLIEHVDGDKDVVHYQLDFNTDDSSKLILTNETEVNGKLKLKDIYETELTLDDSYNDKGKVYTAKINKNEWTTITSVVSKVR